MSRIEFSLTAQERGTSFVELAIIAPALFALIFGAFSLCGQLRGSQYASSLSRELTSAAYRDCLADSAAAGADSDKFNSQQCMDAAVEAFRAQVVNIAPNATYVISLYNYNSGTDTASLTTQSATGGQTSNVSVATFTGADAYGSALMNSLRQLNRLMIGEVFYPEEGRIIYAATVI